VGVRITAEWGGATPTFGLGVVLGLYKPKPKPKPETFVNHQDLCTVHVKLKLYCARA
jgi:hypothetical protein